MKTLKPTLIDDTDFLNTEKPLGSSKVESPVKGIPTNREVFAYGRVSTENQNLGMQVDRFKLLGISDRNIFLDKDSGKKDDREALNELIGKLRKGDKVVFYDLTRLGRNLKFLISLVEHFEEIGVEFQDLCNPFINTESNRTAEGEFIFNVFGALGQMMRRLIQRNVMRGIENAKKEGTQFGRPKGLSPKLKKIADAVVMMHKNPTTTITDITSTFGISRGSVYKIFEFKNYDYKSYHKNNGNQNAKKATIK